VEQGAGPLAGALREAVSLSDAARGEMGQRGRLLAREKYAWPAVARDMLRVYEWLLGRGERPSCVRSR
jgi:glycosyltransferase involved in cell wall biosynthesis